MNKQALVSIVIPCYNHGAFIAETIESVYQSNYPYLEVIVVDDGSKDNSKEVIGALQVSYPNLIYIHQPNAGPAAARNNGITTAKGKYILPLDADDLISPDYIPKAVEVLEQNPSVKVVYCRAEFFGERKGEWKLKPFKLKLLAMDNMIFCSAIYRKTDWALTGGYEERMTWGWEDWEFWVNLLKTGGEVHQLPLIGFFYRVRQNSRRKSTNSEAKKKTIDLINAKHKHFIYLMLGGPLHYQRSMSVFINNFMHISKL